MGLSDLFTGGKNKKAEEALRQAMAQIQAVKTPTSADMQLSPLQQYTNMGDLQAALIDATSTGASAYDNQNLSTVPFETMQKVLGRQMQIADAQGMTPQEQAKIAQAEQAMGRNIAGQRGAIAQDFAGRGIPASLIAAVLQNQSVGQEAQQGYMNALQAQSAASDRGLSALQGSGQLAGQMYGQQSQQANTVAAAQNALNQFNAANTQQANLANQGAKMAANTYNTQTNQNVGNMNVGGKNQAQYQNQVMAPQQAAGLALQKAGLVGNMGGQQANMYTQQGQQEAGLWGGLIGAGATLGAGAMGGPAAGIATGGMPMAGSPRLGQNPYTAAQGGEVPEPIVPAVPFRGGGQVPGQARVPGDSAQNDTIPARLSPGEFVVPRTSMQNPHVRNFLSENVPTPNPPSTHPSDIASIVKALTLLRAGV